MGGKASTAAGGAITAASQDTSGTLNRESDGVSGGSLGLLRSASQGAGGSAGDHHSNPHSHHNSQHRHSHHAGATTVSERTRTRSLSSVTSGQLTLPMLLSRAAAAAAASNGFKCPICSKWVLPDDLECHLVICLTKPRITYNEDTLTEDKGECVICLEDMEEGNTICRLPCLCIYHKHCIDTWFTVNRSCPEHPSD